MNLLGACLVLFFLCFVASRGEGGAPMPPLCKLALFLVFVVFGGGAPIVVGVDAALADSINVASGADLDA